MAGAQPAHREALSTGGLGPEATHSHTLKSINPRIPTTHVSFWEVHVNLPGSKKKVFRKESVHLTMTETRPFSVLPLGVKSAIYHISHGASEIFEQDCGIHLTINLQLFNNNPQAQRLAEALNFMSSLLHTTSF